MPAVSSLDIHIVRGLTAAREALPWSIVGLFELVVIIGAQRESILASLFCLCFAAPAAREQASEARQQRWQSLSFGEERGITGQARSDDAGVWLDGTPDVRGCRFQVAIWACAVDRPKDLRVEKVEAYDGCDAAKDAKPEDGNDLHLASPGHLQRPDDRNGKAEDDDIEGDAHSREGQGEIVVVVAQGRGRQWVPDTLNGVGRDELDLRDESEHCTFHTTFKSQGWYFRGIDG